MSSGMYGPHACYKKDDLEGGDSSPGWVGIPKSIIDDYKGLPRLRYDLLPY